MEEYAYMDDGSWPLHEEAFNGGEGVIDLEGSADVIDVEDEDADTAKTLVDVEDGDSEDDDGVDVMDVEESSKRSSPSKKRTVWRR